MDFLKTRVFSFVDDRLQRYSLIGFIAIFAFSVLNYVDEQSIEWLLRMSIYGAGIFLVFFFGNRGTWITWFLVAYILFHFSHYRNVSYFTIVMILISFCKKTKIPLIILYAINLFSICHLHEITVKQLFFHACCCAFIYVSVVEVQRRIENIKDKNLALTPDEITILEYLIKGINQNDIPDFSAQTVSRKLRHAKIRNCISSTKLLKDKYLEEKIIENKD